MSGFPKTWAIGVIGKMQDYYQARFDNTFPKRSGLTDQEYIDKLADIACDVFDGLTPDDIKRGLSKMKTSKFCPVFPEFRDWCLPDLKSKWLGANEAWNIARGSIDFNGNDLTVVWTRECAIAFDSVCNLVKLGDKYQIAEARKTFTEMYDRLVLEALEKRLQPVYEISYGDDKEQRKTALREAEIAGYLSQGTAQPLLGVIQTPSDAKNEDAKFKTLAQEHLAKIKGLLKSNGTKIEVEVESFNHVASVSNENLPEWADPFDQHEAYKAGLKNDKKATPFALTEWEKRNGIGG